MRRPGTIRFRPALSLGFNPTVAQQGQSPTKSIFIIRLVYSSLCIFFLYGG